MVWLQTLPAAHDPKAVTVLILPGGEANFEPTTRRPEVATADSVPVVVYPVNVHVSCQKVLGLLY